MMKKLEKMLERMTSKENLGNTLAEQLYQESSDKREAISQLPTPRDQSELRSSLGDHHRTTVSGHRRTGGEAVGGTAALPPQNFEQLRFFWVEREIWAQSVLREFPIFLLFRTKRQTFSFLT